MKALGIIFSNIHDRDIPELTSLRTLASIPFGGRYRLIDFALSNLVNAGVRKVGVITKNNYQSLMDHLGSGKHWDLSRKNGGLMILPPFGVVSSQSVYHTRFEALQGALNFLKHSTEDFVIMSDCDIVCNMDFKEAVEQHTANNADITLIVREKEVEADKLRKFVECDASGRVTKFWGSSKETGNKLLYTNIAVIGRKYLINILENARELRIKSFSADVLERGVSEKRKVMAYKFKGYFANIDSLANYYEHSLQLLDADSRRSLFKKEGAPVYTKVRDSVPARFSQSAAVSNSLIADACVIEGEVVNSIIFRGVRVARGARVAGSILMQDTKVGEGSSLNCVIADKSVRIGDKRILSGHETHPYFLAKNSII